MSAYPEDLVYTRDHEWARLEDRDGAHVATIGIMAFAVHQLGDVTQVELPQKGASVKQGGVFGSVESVKAVSDLFAPMTGTVIEVNAALADKPELLNDDPYVGGWMIQVLLANQDELAALLSPDTYRTLLRDETE